jgi:hypothetical protein
MVLEWLGLEAASGRQAILDCIRTQSVWTADLVLYLDRVLFGSGSTQSAVSDRGGVDAGGGVDAITGPGGTGIARPSRSLGGYLFCSQTLSVNDELSSFAYYQRAFDEDRVRVQEIFERLQERHPNRLVQRNSVPLDDIVAIVRRPDCVAIVLVDNAVLTGLRHCSQLASGPDRSGDEVEPEEGGNPCPVNDGPSEHQPDETHIPTLTNSTVLYMGHYILLTGVVSTRNVVVGDDSDNADYDDDEDEDEPFMFQVQNPALDFGPVLLSPRLLDQARVAPGTDQDVIFVAKAADLLSTYTESGA